MLFSKTDLLPFYLNARLQTLNLVAVTPANCIATFRQFRRFDSECLQRAFHQFVNDQINERLKSALAGEDADEVATPLSEPDPVRSDDEEGDARIVTTEEEWEAFFAVKSILYDTIDLSRIAMRDRVSYCGILLDDNNRKPICRLHFNGSQKYLGVFDANKKDVRMPIDSVNDIYQYSDQLKSICHVYEG